ncbi:MAG: hypothetical protein H0X36_04620 [Sphingomonadaceae bacterium]|nr:hypothetical protein [Sphingomonadaceae bacterium]
MKTIFAIAAGAAVAAGAPAAAHHSFAMFDKNKEIELKDATVKEWQWTSPHTWLFAVGSDGTKYSIEGGNPGLMRRQGFSKGSMAPGDKVTIYVSPLKSGQKGGSINAVRLADGRTLGERMKR